MNHCVPNWNIVDEPRQPPQLLTSSEQKTFMGPDPELSELLWRNGQVIVSSQTLRKPVTTYTEPVQIQKPDQQSKAGGSPTISSSLLQADETASWFQYPLDEVLEKEFPYFYDIPCVESVRELPISQSKARPQSNVKQYNNFSFEEDHVPPTKLQANCSIAGGANLNNVRTTNFSLFSLPEKGGVGYSKDPTSGPRDGGNGIEREAKEASMVTVGSSYCGSNQIQNDADLSRISGMFVRPAEVDAHKNAPQNEKGNNVTMDTTVTSSSGGSGASLARTSKQTKSNQSHKRKGRNADESECQSEEAGYDSAEASKPASRSTSARRSRAAEVHNLSERRRRDRINEKMRALQELIPHCNKSDKASMLDEAIEYLKSLQLQVQLMWMGSGMAPMMYPGVQHYMPRMGMAMNPTALASLHSHLQMPRVPIVDPSVAPSGTPNPPMCQPQLLNPINFQHQMQGPNLPEAYARYLGFHSMQMGQAVNLFPYGSQTMQATQRAAAPSSSVGPCNVGVSLENAQNGNLG